MGVGYVHMRIGVVYGYRICTQYMYEDWGRMGVGYVHIVHV